MKGLQTSFIVLFLYFNLAVSASARRSVPLEQNGLTLAKQIIKPKYARRHFTDYIKLSTNAVRLTYTRVNYLDNRVFSHNTLEYCRLDNAIDNENTYIELRDPRAVFAIALVPGFFIHGLGHAYIGDNRTAGILFLTEGSSIATFAAIWPYLISVEPDFKPKPLYISIASISAIAFLLSWQVDV